MEEGGEESGSMKKKNRGKGEKVTEKREEKERVGARGGKEKWSDGGDGILLVRYFLEYTFHIIFLCIESDYIII